MSRENQQTLEIYEVYADKYLARSAGSILSQKSLRRNKI